MKDQIIDAATAARLHGQAAREHPLVVWLVLVDEPAYPGRLVARLLTDAPSPYVLVGTPSPYVLVADTLAEMHAQIPPGLVRTGCLPSDPSRMLEMWYQPDSSPSQPA